MTVESMAKFDLEQLPHLLPQIHNAKPRRYPLHLTRQVMRGLAVIGLCCAFVVLILAAVMANWSLLVWDLPVIAVCVIYNSADLITARVNKKGFHPGVSVAADLIISAVLLFVGALELVRGDQDTHYAYEQLLTAGGSILVVIGLLHFVLFIICCVATHKYRHATRQPQVVVYLMQPPAAPIVKRKAVPDADTSSSAATSRAAVHDDDVIASHEDAAHSTTVYSPPTSPTLPNRSSVLPIVFDARHSLPPTAVHAHISPTALAVIDANAITANAERSQLARAPSSATTTTIYGPPPSYSRYEDNLQPISADQLAMLPPAPPGMVYLVASSNGHEKIMTR